jgi:hypothetical protein
MAEKDKIFDGKIKQSGIFDFKELYSFAYDWLSDQGYGITERAYGEQVTGDSKKVDITWEAKKKVSDYFKFFIKMDWQLLGLKSIKVKKDDKEISMNSGSVEIKFKAFIIKDYENRWEEQPFWKFLRGVYDRYVIRTRIDEYEDKIRAELGELIAQIKSFLAIEGKV